MKCINKLAVKGRSFKNRVLSTLRDNSGSNTVEIIIIIAVIVVIAIFLIPNLKEGFTEMMLKMFEKVMSIFDMT